MSIKQVICILLKYADQFISPFHFLVTRQQTERINILNTLSLLCALSVVVLLKNRVELTALLNDAFKLCCFIFGFIICSASTALVLQGAHVPTHYAQVFLRLSYKTRSVQSVQSTYSFPSHLPSRPQYYLI